MVVHGIRIAETGVRFSPGPQNYIYDGQLAQFQPEADPPLAEVRAKHSYVLHLFCKEFKK